MLVPKNKAHNFFLVLFSVGRRDFVMDTKTQQHMEGSVLVWGGEEVSSSIF